MADFAKRRRDLRFWNILVGTVHASSFVALLALTLTNLNIALTRPLWVDFGGALRVLGAAPLAATLLPFPVITALFHFFEAADFADYYRLALRVGVTPHRWIEYSITNGLMTWSVLVLAGVGNVPTLVAALLVNVTMQYFGFAHERENVGAQTTLAFVGWGFLPWLVLWFWALAYYAASAAEQPTFVGVAVVGSFLLSLTFVAPLIYRYRTKTPALEANYRTERAYLLLSLTAKLFLDWTVTVGNILEAHRGARA